MLLLTTPANSKHDSGELCFNKELTSLRIFFARRFVSFGSQEKFLKNNGGKPPLTACNSSTSSGFRARPCDTGQQHLS